MPTSDAEAERRETNSDEVLNRLDRELVGLTPVKTRIREIADLLVVDRLRQRFGISSTRPTLHMSFTGSPGTGKTTVTVRMAELLHRMGYLARGHLAAVISGGAMLVSSASAAPPVSVAAEVSVAAARASAPPFNIVATDFGFEGVPRKIRATPGALTTFSLANRSTTEAHEFVIVRLKDTPENQRLSLARAKTELVGNFNFEAQADPANVGGFTPGFLSTTKPGGIRDASMGGRADVFRASFGGTDTHEVEAVPPSTTGTNGLDVSRPGRYLYFCPITARVQNDPHQEPHYLQTPGQIGFLQVV